MNEQHLITVPKYVDSRTFAQMYNLNVETPAHWRARKVGPRYVRIGRVVRYAVTDLAEWAQRNAVEPKNGTPAAC
jgi:hypothetical protein